MIPKVGRPFIPVLYFGIFAPIPLSLLMYKDISPTCKLLWGRLAFYLGKDGQAYPSQATLAKDLSVSKRAIARSLKSLEKTGFLEMEPGTGRTTTRYHLLFHEIFKDEALNKPKASPGQALGSALYHGALRTDTNVHPPNSRADTNVHPQSPKGGQVVPLRGDTSVYQKRTSSKDHKEEKKTRARGWTDEQHDWLRAKLGMDVFHRNLVGQEIQARKDELTSLVEGGAPCEPSLETLREERSHIEEKILEIESQTARETLLDHLNKGTLAQKNLEEFRQLSRSRRVNAV